MSRLLKSNYRNKETGKYLADTKKNNKPYILYPDKLSSKNDGIKKKTSKLTRDRETLPCIMYRYLLKELNSRIYHKDFKINLKELYSRSSGKESELGEDWATKQQ